VVIGVACLPVENASLRGTAEPRRTRAGPPVVSDRIVDTGPI
jgi:hypothetical protein